MEYLYTATFTPMENGAGYEARVPDLPGCITTGKSLSDAIKQISDAAGIWLVCAEDEGDAIPEAKPQHCIQREAGAELSIIRIDTIAYRNETDGRAVRKNVSLPAWMAKRADKLGINCSQVLQESLLSLLS